LYYKIYPDVIFLTNLLLDYTVLAVSCRLCKITTTYLRLTIAAGIGAAWSVMVAVVGNEGITVLFCTYLCMPVAMLYIAGCRGGPGEWLYRYAVLMGVAVLLGGVMSQAHDRSSTVLVTMVTAVLFLQAAVPLIGYLTGYVKRKNLLYKVTLRLDGRSTDVWGLFDTGNSLTDPYSGEPVCIVEKKALAGLMQSDALSDGITLIPYKSLGKEHGLMRLVTMDCMMVEYEGRTRRYEYPKIALYEGSLSKKGEYSMILNTASLNRK
jgi:sigma-E processing peptidase SpoIIGA